MRGSPVTDGDSSPVASGDGPSSTDDRDILGHAHLSITGGSSWRAAGSAAGVATDCDSQSIADSGASAWLAAAGSHQHRSSDRPRA